MSQFGLLVRLYTNPLRTFSRVIDEGRLLFAIVAAVTVLLALQAPRAAEHHRRSLEKYSHLVAAAKAAGGAEMGDDLAETMASAMEMVEPMRGAGWLGGAVDLFTLRSPVRYFPPLVALALCFIPLAILVVTMWDGLGSVTTILFRDYLALLACGLLAWTAAYLPLAAINGVQLYLHLPGYDHAAIWWVCHGYFLALTVCAIRTVMGSSFTHAGAAVGGAWAGSVGGIWLHSMTGGVSLWLMSPCLMYYVYANLQHEFRSFGGGLRSRRFLKQHLECATANPLDGDAHCQLGLIYLQRKQTALAAERFRKAIEIDAREPDPHYQLGRILREQGEYAAAIESLRTAARLDDRHSMSEVWRELGAASVLAGQAEEARQALEKYLERRAYDPEGLCWYGRALARLGLPEAASEAFDRAIDAVRTMPPARKRQVRMWEGEAVKELKRLKGATRSAALR